MTLAGCIIKDDSGKILLIHRNKPTRVQWEIPGGKVDPGEALEQTAIREVKEELGITVTLVRSLGSQTFEENGADHEYHWFEAKIEQGRPTIIEEQTFDQLAYFTLAEMHAMHDQLSANAKNFVAAMTDNTN